MSAEAWINMSAPLKADGSFDKCNVFDVDYSLTFARPGENTPTRACQAWDYDEEYFTVRSMIIENKNRDLIIPLCRILRSCAGTWYASGSSSRATSK